MLVSSPYFRTHKNVGLQVEVPEKRNGDDVDTASESHTLSSSQSTSSTVSKRKKSDTSDLCATLTKFTASRESTTKQKQLTVFLEDIAQTMATFPEVDLAETKREIFNLVNKKEVELLMRKQS
jgi:hypothetical protein